MKIARIVVQAADIYKDHTFTSEVVTQGLMSEEVAILDTYENWSRIEQWDGYKGWINNFYLSKITDCNKIPNYIHQGYDKALLESFNSEKLRDKIVDYCRAQLEIPYKWGGKSPLGYDCSGLIQMSFKAHGFSLPRDSKDQYEILKENKVKLNEAKPGDILFFKQKGRICHVGMYSNNLRFIHSSGMVKENSLDEEDKLFDKKLMNKFEGVFSISGIIK